MNETTVPRAPLLSLDPNTVRVDVCASEPSPAYPALFAAALHSERASKTPRVRVTARRSHRELLDSITRGECTLAAMSASRAARAILEGLPAKIVCAAVAPVDYAALEREPAVRWDRVGPFVRSLPPRAVLVAPSRWLEVDPTSVRAAIDAYWNAALDASRDIALLSVVLATELGFPSAAAEHEARMAVAGWRLEPAVRAEGLEGVLAQIAKEGVFTAPRAEWLLDERFVPVTRGSPWAA